ncbi:hypothetical protein Smic_37700 [Streptomyces microflavus]|uniref:Uncharacterized protein n=1 Tax=Streptomyces microflavus TaxID=1919 RepID=A0A7J0CTE0_STRMI|nr:hypothetical protein Smic_37700 [Streptomyces microflavus]
MRRSGPSKLRPAEVISRSRDPAPTMARAPRRERVAGSGSGAARGRGGGGVRLAARDAGPQHPYGLRQLQRHMGDESGEEDPRPVEVQGVEGPREEVVQLDVEQPGEELEQRPAHEEQQRDPLQGVAHRPGGRQREQARDHRPELRQQHGYEHDADRDVQPLRQPVEPVRSGRPGEQVEAQQPLVRGLVVDRVQVRVVRGVREQAGDEQQGEPDEEDETEHGGEAHSAHRAAPEAGVGGRAEGGEAIGKTVGEGGDPAAFGHGPDAKPVTPLGGGCDS